MKEELRMQLRQLADRYETADFTVGDPSWFMHQVSGTANQEVMAFIASVLSYGRRDLFMPKINSLLGMSRGDIAGWISARKYVSDIPDNKECFYRLYNNHMMNQLFDALSDMLNDYGSIGNFVKVHAQEHTAVEGLTALAGFFQQRGIKGMVPAPVSSVAKRPCMLMRWMVRDESPVDIGLWTSFIDKRSLLIPMDTHVLQEAQALGLVSSKSASWHSVVTLTEAMREVFPDDPARGDFALFGYGINKGDG